MDLAEAGPGDLAAVAALMNRAYRGGGGWTSEAGYITGARTRPELIAADLAASRAARMLVMRTDAGEKLAGCVWLEPGDGTIWQLGSLTVDPLLQDQRIGRSLLEAAERWAAARGAQAVRMTVVHLRATLIAWYGRRGYRATGEVRPWPYEDARFGVPTRDDLQFVVLEKRLPGVSVTLTSP